MLFKEIYTQEKPINFGQKLNTPQPACDTLWDILERVILISILTLFKTFNIRTLFAHILY